MSNDIIKTTEQRMVKAVEALKAEFSKLRTGRANSGLLDHLMVPYYGSNMPLNQVANITVSDARTLTVSPWEKNLVSAIEKAIREADLGLNPATTGDLIRVPVPALTEDRRKQMTKLVKGEAENAKVAVRNIRRDANTHIKDLLKDKKINEDDERRAEEQVQKLTDKIVAEIDKLLAAKEADLMEV
jgi:ribosome recycling factor